MISAHIAGVPVEEFLPTLVGTGAGLAVVRARVRMRMRRRRRPRSS